MNYADVGHRGEEIARKLLKKRGYRILDTNVRGYFGEIDIVARQKRCHVFVEVRTKSGDAFGTPEESITQQKKNKLITCALAYVASHPELHESEWRIDVVAVELDKNGRQVRAEILESAVPTD